MADQTTFGLHVADEAAELKLGNQACHAQKLLCGHRRVPMDVCLMWAGAYGHLGHWDRSGLAEAFSILKFSKSHSAAWTPPAEQEHIR